MPLLVLLPIYLRLERGHRLRWPLAALLGFLLLVELATLSRSGLLGLACGMLVLAVPYRRRLLSARFLVPLGAVALLVLAFVAQRADFFETVLRSRVDTGGRGTSTHFVVYDFIPDVLSSNPLFGLGLNNFSVYYEFVTGRTNFGPHSFYVALLVETGLVGALVFAAFVVWIFRRLGLARRVGAALAAARDPVAARVRPLAWGLTAALVGTLAANAFYLTMSFYYFFVFALLAISPAAVFGRRRLAQLHAERARRRSGRSARPRRPRRPMAATRPCSSHSAREQNCATDAEVVADEDDRLPGRADVVEGREALLLEARVADGEDLVEQEDVERHLDRDREREADLHARGVVLQLLVDEPLELGEGDDLVEALRRARASTARAACR